MNKHYKAAFKIDGQNPATYEKDLPDDQPEYYVTDIGAARYARRVLKRYKARGDKRPWTGLIYCIEPDGPTGAKATAIEEITLCDETTPSVT